MYHLGWFLGTGYGLLPWQPQHSFHATGVMNDVWTGRAETEWMKPSFWVDMTTSLERAGFDYLMIEDTSGVDDSLGGSYETTLRLGLFAPKNDPMPLVPLLAAQSKHIGIVTTITSTFYPPYLAARLLTTLDHLTDGRVGFNLVTGSSNQAAQNYGMDELPSKEERYAMANEWVHVVKALQESWEPDAVLADVERGIYADHAKVHRLDHQGKYYKVRGPLNTIPGPQRSIPMLQAGNSPAGRDISARYSDVLLAVGTSIESMKSLREDMHSRLRAYGRDPSLFKIMYIVDVTLGATDEEAQARDERNRAARWNDASMENIKWFFASNARMDFTKYDLDAPVETVIEDIRQNQDMQNLISSVERYLMGRSGQTLREALATIKLVPDLGLVGSPETVASKLDEVMEEVGGDGYLFSAPTRRVDIAEICDGLAPVLRRRGSIRPGYEGRTFRENLMAF